MINIKDLTLDDKKNILMSAQEIRHYGPKVDCLQLKKANKKIQLPCSMDTVLNGESTYGFIDEGKVSIALYYLFCSDYNAKRLARNAYIYDEDEKLCESVDCDIPLGYVKAPNGTIKESGTVEFTLKIRKLGDIHPVTKLPFDIVGIRLIDPAA